jgi:hypothetical protein
MAKTRGYSNDATDTVKCFLLNDEKHFPHVSKKSADEIKAYFLANEKEVMGGCYGDGKYYPAHKVVWSEIELAATLESDSPFGHIWMQFDVERLAKEYNIGPFKWRAVKGCEMISDSYEKKVLGITKRVTESRPSELTARFENYTLRKLFFFQNGSLGFCRFIIEENGKAIEGCEHGYWLTSPTDHKLHGLKSSDRFFQYYLLRMKGIYTQRTIILHDKKGQQITEGRVKLDAPSKGDAWTGPCEGYVSQINPDGTVRVGVKKPGNHPLGEGFYKYDVSPHKITVVQR